jgi:VIT1/CCC1 family predicted Fe2+/Mn2+ transporter
MGLGAYLAAVTDRDHYMSEEKREHEEVLTKPDDEREECHTILANYGISREASAMVLKDLEANPDCWVQFMMDFELKLEKPEVSRAWISAVTMGLSYFIGGLIPMIPYFAMSDVTHALFVSIGITIVILLSFGYAKTWFTVHTHRLSFLGAIQTLTVGALAAGASYGIVRAIDSTRQGGTCS